MASFFGLAADVQDRACAELIGSDVCGSECCADECVAGVRLMGVQLMAVCAEEAKRGRVSVEDGMRVLQRLEESHGQAVWSREHCPLIEISLCLSPNVCSLTLKPPPLKAGARVGTRGDDVLACARGRHSRG